MSIDIQTTYKKNSQNNCARCGACCIKGGPALHQEDISLILKGVILPSHLITFRLGELAINPETNAIIELPCEMIKIRGESTSSWQCLFYAEDKKACKIYKTRPLECRKLKCWDPTEIKKLFLKKLLSRSDLIPKKNPIWQIINGYEKTFSIKRILETAQAAKSNIVEAKKELEHLKEADQQFRNKVSKAFGLPISELNFYLGRPVADIISQQ